MAQLGGAAVTATATVLPPTAAAAATAGAQRRTPAPLRLIPSADGGVYALRSAGVVDKLPLSLADLVAAAPFTLADGTLVRACSCGAALCDCVCACLC